MTTMMAMETTGRVGALTHIRNYLAITLSVGFAPLNIIVFA